MADNNNSWSISKEKVSEMDKGVSQEMSTETNGQVNDTLRFPEIRQEKLENENNSNTPEHFPISSIDETARFIKEEKGIRKISVDINNSQRAESVHDLPRKASSALLRKNSTVLRKKSSVLSTSQSVRTSFSMTKALEAVKKNQRSKSTNRKKGIKCLNTYRLSPLSGHEFSWLMACHTVTSAVNAFFNFDNYDLVRVRAGMKHLADVVVHRLSDHPAHDRFKLVSHVTVAQLNNQGVEVADRALGHAGMDNCFTLTRRMRDYVVVCSVYGIYVE